jgi:hypothetical protein
MRITRGFLPRLLVATLLAMPLVAVVAGPAAADTKCSNQPPVGVFYPPHGSVYQVDYDACMNLEKTGAHRYWGDRRYSPTLPGIVRSETVIVKQCDGLGHNCTVVSSTHTPPTSKKVAAYGHAYITCASVTFIDGRNFVNRCSPFISYP